MLATESTGASPRVWVLAALVCGGLAALTLLMPSTPTTDAWAWIVWGRELVEGDLDTDVGASPSWKPLPVLATAPLSLLGDDAPALWLLTSRGFGLLGLVFAFRLAYVLMAADRTRADQLALSAVAAGALAVIAVVLSKGWVRTFVFGFSEPAAMAFMFMALERHLAGRYRQAMVLGALVTLARPEAFPLLALYGCLLLATLHRSKFDWLLVATVLLVVPVLWVLPDWISTGDPFHSTRAASAVWAREDHRLVRTLTISAAPLFFTAVGGALVVRRRGDRAFPGIVALAFSWIGLLILARLAGYPASPRFFVVPETVLAVVGAAGALILIEAARDPWLRATVAGAAGVLLTVLFAPQIGSSTRLLRGSQARARTESALVRAIGQAGGERLHHCGTPRLPYGSGWIKGAVAWRLHVHTEDVHRIQLTHAQEFVQRAAAGLGPPPGVVTARVRHQRRPAVLFLPIDGTPAREMGPRGVLMEPLTSVHAWAVFVSGRRCGPRPD